MSIKLKYGGIKGESMEKPFEGFIDIISFSVSSNKSIRSSTTNNSNTRTIGAPSISEIQFRKPMCLATPSMMHEVLRGKAEEAEFHFVRTSPSGHQVSCIYKVFDAILTSHNFSINVNEDMEESFTLSFTKMDIAFKKFDEKGNISGQSVVAFDFIKMQ